MKIYLIINEQHKLLSEQEDALREFGWKGETIQSPANGWTRAEMEEIGLNAECLDA